MPDKSSVGAFEPVWLHFVIRPVVSFLGFLSSVGLFFFLHFLLAGFHPTRARGAFLGLLTRITIFSV